MIQNRIIYVRQRTRLEVFDMLRRNLSNLKQSHRTVIVDEGTTLDVGLGLVGDLHQEFGLRFNHMLKDFLVDAGELYVANVIYYTLFKDLHSTQIIRVGHEKVFLALSKELVKNTRMKKGVVQVTVARRVPVLLVVVSTLGARQKRFFEDTRVS